MSNQSMVKLAVVAFVLGTVCLIQVAQGQDGCGTNVWTLPNFEPGKFAGRWYVQLQSISVDNACGEVDVVTKDNGLMYTKYSTHIEGEDQPKEISGVVNANEIDMVGVFGNLKSEAHFVNYVIIATDYETNALVYTCRHDGLYSFAYLSRKTAPDATFIEGAKKLSNSFGLDWSRMFNSRENCE